MNGKTKLITKQRILNHFVFWILATAILTTSYSISFLDYYIAFIVIIMFIPVHAFYFYSISYFVIPKFLFKKKYIAFILSFFLITIFCGFLFRSIEIFFSDPYIYKKMLLEKPETVWRKLEGSIWEQYIKPVYIINAFEQSNTIVWVGISLKFFLMWNNDREEALKAELKFLKNQIHPHFLFNTLNNLYSLTLQQSKQSPLVVLKLSDILRYMLYECDTLYVPLKKDLLILESYIGIEQLRYKDDMLQVNLSVEGSLEEAYIAPLLILPYVENAFKHGASEITGSAWINIEIKVVGNKFKFKISNNKPLIADVKKFANGNIGLINVEKRLNLIYRNAYLLKIYDIEDVFVVNLELQMDKVAKVQPKMNLI